MENLDANNTKSEQLDFVVVIAEPSDWSEYREIRLEALTQNPEAFGETLDKALRKTDGDWKRDLEKSSTKFVCLVRSNNKAVGMAGTKERDDFGPKTWFVFAMYVSVGMRGKKVGEKLLQEIEKEIRTRAGEKVVLFVGPGQAEAIGLYTKLGFIADSTKNSNSPDGRVWLYMEKLYPHA